MLKHGDIVICQKPPHKVQWAGTVVQIQLTVIIFYTFSVFQKSSVPFKKCAHETSTHHGKPLSQISSASQENSCQLVQSCLWPTYVYMSYLNPCRVQPSFTVTGQGMLWNTSFSLILHSWFPNYKVSLFFFFGPHRTYLTRNRKRYVISYSLLTTSFMSLVVTSLVTISTIFLRMALTWKKV